jgi:hypothetical protein
MNGSHQKPSSLTVQLLRLKTRFPHGEGRIRRERLTWNQTICPHTLAHTYRCRLEYAVGEYPKIYCVDPPLSELVSDRELPHVFTHDEPVCMCLFMRTRDCWNDRMLLANIVIPLAYYWLAHFEDWLFSGVWRGGGTHPVDVCPPLNTPRFQ